MLAGRAKTSQELCHIWFSGFPDLGLNLFDLLMYHCITLCPPGKRGGYREATKLHSANLIHNARLDGWTREWGDSCEWNIWYHLVICPAETFDKQQWEGCFHAMFWMEPIAFTNARQLSQKKIKTVRHRHKYLSSRENKPVVCEQN